MFFYNLQVRLENYVNQLHLFIFGGAKTCLKEDLPTPNKVEEVISNEEKKLVTNFMSKNPNLKGAEGLVKHAYKVSNIMIELSHDPQIRKQTVNFTGTNRVISAYLEVSSNNSTARTPAFALHNLESSFIDSIDSGMSSMAYKLRLNGKSLASSNVDKILHTAVNQSISDSLSIAKQTRWLTRNLPVSECLSVSNFTYTQAKILVGNPLFNSAASSKNIWSSSKANDLLLFAGLPSDIALHGSNVTQSSAINHFEDSRSYLNKKAYITLQPGLNITALSSAIGGPSTSFENYSNVSSQTELLPLDMNTLLASTTLSSGSVIVPVFSGNNITERNLLLTDDYLNYFVSSYDNLVISLNTTNVGRSNNLGFYTPLTFTVHGYNINL